MDLIAKREGVEPRQQKKWSKILEASAALAFAIAPCIPLSSNKLMVSVAIWHVS